MGDLDEDVLEGLFGIVVGAKNGGGVGEEAGGVGVPNVVEGGGVAAGERVEEGAIVVDVWGHTRVRCPQKDSHGGDICLFFLKFRGERWREVVGRFRKGWIRGFWFHCVCGGGGVRSGR